MAKLNMKIMIAIVLLIIGGILNILLSIDIGIGGSGIILALFGAVSFFAVYGIWKLKPEAWLGCLVLYVLLILITLLLGGYIQLGINILVLVWIFFIKDVFGIRLKKDTVLEKETVTSISNLKDDELTELSKKVGVNVRGLKCPKCHSGEISVEDDASGVCLSCKYGIRDVTKLAQTT